MAQRNPDQKGRACPENRAPSEIQQLPGRGPNWLAASLGAQDRAIRRRRHDRDGVDRSGQEFTRLRADECGVLDLAALVERGTADDSLDLPQGQRTFEPERQRAGPPARRRQATRYATSGAHDERDRISSSPFAPKEACHAPRTAASSFKYFPLLCIVRARSLPQGKNMLNQATVAPPAVRLARECLSIRARLARDCGAARALGAVQPDTAHIGRPAGSDCSFRTMTFALRSADAADYPVLARLFPELGVADPVPTAEQFASRLLPRVVILEQDGEARGYSYWQVYGGTAQVVHLVVDPQVRGRGVGRVLMQEVQRRVLAERCERWYLNVKQDNAAALALYRRCGLSIEYEGWATRITWAQLATLPEAPGAAVAYILKGTEDEEIAASLCVNAERLAMLRKRRDVILLAVREANAPVAVAAFDPTFPRIYPIRVARPELARLVFDALRSAARHEHVYVSVEGDQVLFDRLRAAGADLLHVFYRMSGALG